MTYDLFMFLAKCVFVYCVISLAVHYKELRYDYSYLMASNTKLRNQMKVSFEENRTLHHKITSLEKSKFHTEVDAEKARYVTRSKSKSPKKDR